MPSIKEAKSRLPPTGPKSKLKSSVSQSELGHTPKSTNRHEILYQMKDRKNQYHDMLRQYFQQQKDEELGKQLLLKIFYLKATYVAKE